MSDSSVEKEARIPRDFIREFVREDLKNGRYSGVHTRFPPEPNGWLHIGHAKALVLDFDIAREFDGLCNLRFDDTNPEKGDISYVNAIKNDVKWLGFDWEDREYYASDYYEYLYEMAIKLIKKGLAYVDDLSDEDMRVYRGTAVQDKHNIIETPPGKNSPWRERSIEENVDLFTRMRNGEFPDGSKTLRAKIDMTHPNLVMRDPVMYRIRRLSHYRVGDAWCIYPMYDFQHPLSDAKEGITHSLCSLEYEIHRPLYEWFIEHCEVFPSRQIEFARLNITKTVLSKRWLLQLVQEKHVWGWDDPRMPTLSGLRRRGFTPEAIRDFMSRIGVAKTDSIVDVALLEHCLREDLNRRAYRAMAVMKPLKLIIENWGEQEVDELEAVNNPEDEASGKRLVHFTKELWIDAEDFQEIPPKKYFRLYPGNSVRLRWAYIVTCTSFEKDPATGEITKVYCTVDRDTRGGNAPDNRKVKGTIQWLSTKTAIPLEVRNFDYLFTEENPMSLKPGESFLDKLNTNSLEIIKTALGEPCLNDEKSANKFWQFERIGYFYKDSDSTLENPVYNRSVGLRDTWGKIEKKQTKQQSSGEMPT